MRLRTPEEYQRKQRRRGGMARPQSRYLRESAKKFKAMASDWAKDNRRRETKDPNALVALREVFCL